MYRHPYLTGVPRDSRGSRRAGGFTLIELLVVMAIIIILVGMYGAAAYAARQNAYRAQAQAEAREIASAFRAYRATFGEWPKGLVVGGGLEPLDKVKLEGLIGDDSDKGDSKEFIFLNLTDKDFGRDNYGNSDALLDPWGNAYHIKLDEAAEAKKTIVFQTAVDFPMRSRHSLKTGN